MAAIDDIYLWPVDIIAQLAGRETVPRDVVSYYCSSFVFGGNGVRQTFMVQYGYLVLYTYCLAGLNMRAGDVVSCHLNGFLGKLGAKHWMLATGPDTVIHTVTTAFYTTTAYIREMRLSEVSGWYKCSCKNWGKYYTERTRQQAVSSARNYRDDIFFYNSIMCNCQHWVNKWTTGAGGFSTSSVMWAAPFCKAY
ncbi:hypothetical protein J6590_043174 [Homalodisca vitripennis]|nr:hypothetical protein J6590_043174 [Homalodisca vitripennis]